MEETQLVKAFGAFLAIMNPFVTLPLFIALTAGYTVAQQRFLAIKITIFCAIMAGIILLGGQQIINFFGIGINQFRIAGGVVLASIAWNMLQGDNSPSHQGTPAENAQMQDLTGLAFYPITFPMIVGPGAIATIIIYAGRDNSLVHTAEIAAIIGAVLFIMFLVLFFASRFTKVMTQTMRTITTRLMGMILLAIAIEMIIAGASALFPGLIH